MDENRGAFVEGRSLIHNVRICHDILRHYNRKTTPRCFMKIDLKKAYDMVSWDFLEEALKGYGFPIPFVNLFMKCVTSTKFTIKVNGKGYKYFEGKKGLGQGDPMSPLLFVLIMEYLTRIL
ncbi:MAG: reverse transcriptase domain-containing protein, partial [Candidatus Phytoplasma australasiaticum]|nr:reverse transcriptase domain-containing protein [Candidatus Phytoplasma australasiaticum]